MWLPPHFIKFRQLKEWVGWHNAEGGGAFTVSWGWFRPRSLLLHLWGIPVYMLPSLTCAYDPFGWSTTWRNSIVSRIGCNSNPKLFGFSGEFFASFRIFTGSIIPNYFTAEQNITGWMWERWPVAVLHRQNVYLHCILFAMRRGMQWPSARWCRCEFMFTDWVPDPRNSPAPVTVFLPSNINLSWFMPSLRVAWKKKPLQQTNLDSIFNLVAVPLKRFHQAANDHLRKAVQIPNRSRMFAALNSHELLHYIARPGSAIWWWWLLGGGS